MIKELKTSSSSAASRLYTETAYFSITTTPVFKAYVSVCTSHKITIKLDSKTLEQHLWTRKDIIWDMSKVINLLNVILAICYLSSKDVTLFFNSELSYSIWENC